MPGCLAGEPGSNLGQAGCPRWACWAGPGHPELAKQAWAGRAGETGWVQLDWAGLGWARLGWAGLEGWAVLGWAGLGWAGLGWAGLGWAGLGWAGQASWPDLSNCAGPGLFLGWAGLS